MSKQPWFKERTIGWGWYPATWQGWLVFSIFLIVYSSQAVYFTLKIMNLSKGPQSDIQVINSTVGLFFLVSIVLMAIFLTITILTGEKISWPPKFKWPK